MKTERFTRKQNVIQAKYRPLNKQNTERFTINNRTFYKRTERYTSKIQTVKQAK